MHLSQFDPFQRTGGLLLVRGTLTAGLRRVSIESVCKACSSLCPGQASVCQRGYVAPRRMPMHKPMHKRVHNTNASTGAQAGRRRKLKSGRRASGNDGCDNM